MHTIETSQAIMVRTARFVIHIRYPANSAFDVDQIIMKKLYLASPIRCS